ncbi:hypothetical protein [Actinomadura sediminis]|uniref:Secreted protein n=1 Tax=Actinomadura sediminis TaxID=1038904 RepID=A0ABW3ERP0_9ACTN
MAAPLSIALAAFAAQPAQAAPAAPVAGVPAIDPSAECPPLPAGQDPRLATCMIMVVQDGSMKLGGITQEISEEMRIVVQALQRTPTSNSEFTSVTMSGRPMKIPGGVFGLLGYPIPAIDDWPGVKVEVQPEYTGGFTFELPNAGLDMKINVLNALAPEGCAIGSAQDPLRLNLGVDFSEITIVTEGDVNDTFHHPPILNMPARDTTFSVPKTSGCWLLGPITDHLAGLPSPSGDNTAEFDTYLALATYAPLTGAAARSAGDPVQRLKSLRIGG